MTRRAAPTIALAAAASVLAAATIANPIDRIRPDAPVLAPYGNHPVGVQTLNATILDSIDVINIEGKSVPRYDRPLTLEVWYPAEPGTTPGGSYNAIMRDGETEVTLTGQAVRNAPPVAGARFPLIVISHGYPGNRYLMSHLGENLASKGYVTVSIDHTDSTYSDQAAFGSTLLHRPLDQAFIVDFMADLPGPIGDIVDTDHTGVIGYSMGGYGALILGGAGVTQASTEFSWGTPNGLLEQHLKGSESHEALMDDRVKAIIAIGPWGNNAGFWDIDGLAGLRVPTLLMAGSEDDVSDYSAMRGIFNHAVGTDRHLLTFDYANHNAAAPMPAPAESWTASEALDFIPFEHYADAVWDTTRMNNVAQHFATAFFDIHLKGDEEKAKYLDLIADASEGLVDLNEAGQPTDDHTHWRGFAPRTAAGLHFESKPKGE